MASTTGTDCSEIGPYLTRSSIRPCYVRDRASSEAAKPLSLKSESQTDFEIAGDGALRSGFNQEVQQPAGSIRIGMSTQRGTGN